MAWNLAKYFGKDYVPSYLAGGIGPEKLAFALQYLAGKAPATMDPQYVGLAARLYNDVYSKFNKTTGFNAPAQVFAKQYWDWLRAGAQTQKTVASTLQTNEYGNIANNVLHYVPGQGYMTEADLEYSDPNQYKAIQAARKKWTEDTGTPNAYYESNPITTGHGAYTQQATNLGWARPIFGAGELYSYKPPAGPPPGINPAPTPPTSTNRNGNYATTSQAGGTAKTVSTAPVSMSQQARETAAKRAGRSISQAGITKVPNMRETYSRMVRQRYGRS